MRAIFWSLVFFWSHATTVQEEEVPEENPTASDENPPEQEEQPQEARVPHPKVNTIEIGEDNPMEVVQEVTILNMMMKNIQNMVSNWKLGHKKSRKFIVRFGGPTLEQRKEDWSRINVADTALIEFDPTLLSRERRALARLAEAENISYGQPRDNVIAFPYAIWSRSLKNVPFFYTGIAGQEDKCTNPRLPTGSLHRMGWERAVSVARKNCWIHGRQELYSDNKWPWNATVANHLELSQSLNTTSLFGESCMDPEEVKGFELMPSIGVAPLMTRIMLEFPHIPISQLVLDVGPVTGQLLQAMDLTTLKKVQSLVMPCQRPDEWPLSQNFTGMWYSDTVPSRPDCLNLLTEMRKLGFEIASFRVLECATSTYMLQMDNKYPAWNPPSSAFRAQKRFS